MSTGEAHYYYLTDAQGSVIAMTDKNGNKVNTYAYDPYGNARTTTETVPNPLRYTGAHLDPRGLYKTGARYYDPTVGRFTQPDPAGHETNAYAYAVGDPINGADPTGTSACSNSFVKAARGALCASDSRKKKINKGAQGVAAGAGVCAVVAGPTPVGAVCAAVGASAAVVSYAMS
ncbi:RHS repeat-associated core domain-containing protein [Streptomyces sp. SID3343]|uniref:RHS repeat-associated core domain-containing protein n=1 Tax=Streptomyces sp. SID3343 TaxID=2690260 RepID=UPI00136987F1|nr:RHS repeat-associated core domain-containing protein [Streptomyces sp. SID3343]MYV97268.1 hypothetical protein [Streptomyces sp. SID3343]